MWRLPALSAAIARILKRGSAAISKSMEKRLVLYLKNQHYNDPFANALHFVATLIAGKKKQSDKKARTFTTLELAHNWLRESLHELPKKQRAAAEKNIRAFPNRMQAEAHAQQWLQWYAPARNYSRFALSLHPSFLGARPWLYQPHLRVIRVSRGSFGPLVAASEALCHPRSSVANSPLVSPSSPLFVPFVSFCSCRLRFLD